MAELELNRLGLKIEGLDARQERRRLLWKVLSSGGNIHGYAVDAWAEVMVQDGRMLFRGRVLDISAGGCYIETEARLQLAPGTPVEIVFRVDDAVFRCEAASRMMRTKGAGFLFANQSAKAQGELERLIRELGREAAS